MGKYLALRNNPWGLNEFRTPLAGPTALLHVLGKP